MKGGRNKHLNMLILCAALMVLPLIFGVLYVRSNIENDPIVENFTAAQKRVKLVEKTIDADRTVKPNRGLIALKESDTRTEMNLANGDTVVSGTLRGTIPNECVVYSFRIKGDAVIHLHDEHKYSVEPLSEGTYDASLIFIDSEEFDFAGYLPKEYKFIEYDCLEYLPGRDGYMRVKKTSKGFDVEIVSQPVDEGCCSDYLYTTSAEDLLDWDDPNADNEWLTYTLDDHTRMTFTGYYMLSEPSYIPYGENIFYRCQACYIGERFTRDDMQNRAAQNFLASIVDTMIKQKNSWGFYPSTCFSLWLDELYGMNPPYYDTRFNSDLMEIFISYYEKTGSQNAYEALKAYETFYMYLIENSSWDDGAGGIWVNDYWAEDNDSTAIHTALNHQIAEMIILYKVSQIAQRDDWKAAADSMLTAIENVGMYWVKPNGELHYMIDKDGNLSEKDYDTLTYNDMYRLQALLQQDYGFRSKVIDQMMEAKLKWMKENNIHGYLGE